MNNDTGFLKELNEAIITEQVIEVYGFKIAKSTRAIIQDAVPTEHGNWYELAENYIAYVELADAPGMFGIFKRINRSRYPFGIIPKDINDESSGFKQMAASNILMMMWLTKLPSPQDNLVYGADRSPIYYPEAKLKEGIPVNRILKPRENITDGT